MVSEFWIRQSVRYRLSVGQSTRSLLPFIYVSAILTLQLSDMMLTAIGLDSGHAEVNPLGSTILHHSGYAGALVEKICITVLMIGMVLRLRRGRALAMSLMVFLCLFTVVSNALVLI
jgi:hypothetical protein